MGTEEESCNLILTCNFGNKDYNPYQKAGVIMDGNFRSYENIKAITESPFWHLKSEAKNIDFMPV